MLQLAERGHTFHSSGRGLSLSPTTSTELGRGDVPWKKFMSLLEKRKVDVLCLPPASSFASLQQNGSKELPIVKRFVSSTRWVSVLSRSPATSSEFQETKQVKVCSSSPLLSRTTPYSLNMAPHSPPVTAPPTWLAGPSLSVRLWHGGGHHPLARLSAESAPPPGATQSWAANGRQEMQPRQRGWRTFWLLLAVLPSLTSSSHPPSPVGNYLVRELLGN